MGTLCLGNHAPFYPTCLAHGLGFAGGAADAGGPPDDEFQKFALHPDH